MKKTKSGTYVHIICALFSTSYEVVNFERMNITSSTNAEKSAEVGKKCQYCKVEKGTLKCDLSTCNRYTHVYCAFKNKMKYIAEDEESNKGWRIQVNKTGGSEEISLNIEDKISQHAIRIYKKVVGIMGNNQKERENLLNNSMELELPNGGRLKGVISLSQQDEKTIKEVEEKIKEERQKNFLQSNGLKYQREATLRVECQGDRQLEEYCSCLQPFDVSKLMVGCESCGKYFLNSRKFY